MSVFNIFTYIIYEIFALSTTTFNMIFEKMTVRKINLGAISKDSLFSSPQM